MDRETTVNISEGFLEQELITSSSTFNGAKGCIDSTLVNWGPPNKAKNRDQSDAKQTQPTERSK